MRAWTVARLPTSLTHRLTPKANWTFPLLATILVSASVPAADALQRQVYAEPHMGTLIQITLFAPDELAGATAAKAGFQRIRELDAALSDYNSESELMRLTRQPSGCPIPVSDDLWEVLHRAQKLSVQSDGAFDVTSAPLVRLWRQARRDGQLPEADAIQDAKERSGYRNLRLDDAAKTVTLLRPGMLLDLGGIAKGYAADEALEILRAHGISRAMVAAAGDIAIGDPPPRETGWRIGVASIDVGRTGLSTTIRLKNCAISTSGDTEQFAAIDGVRYSHIVDPQTGLGLTGRIGVTVLAPDATTADSLSTLISILGPDEGIALVESLSHVEALIVKTTDSGVETIASRSFPRQ